MATYRKNVAVGATMIVALLCLGFMIILFGDAPVRMFRRAQMPVTLRAQSAEGITTGSPVLYLGVNVGRVNRIERAVDQPGVIIQASVEREPPLPANVEAAVRSTLIGGTASISLEPIGGIPKGQLQDHATIQTRAGGANLLPPEFTELAKRLTELSALLQVTVDDWNKSKVVDKVAQTIDSIHRTVENLDKTLGDEQMRGDLKQTLANFRVVSEKLNKLTDNVDKVTVDASTAIKDASGVVKKTGQNIDDLSKQLAQRLDQVAGVLDKFQSVATKLDKGDGTAGKLINDPKLYEALLDTSQELSLTVKDLRRLVEQWEQEGVTFKLGGNKK